MFSAAALILGCSLVQAGRRWAEIHVCSQITKLFDSLHQIVSAISKTQEKGEKRLAESSSGNLVYCQFLLITNLRAKYLRKIVPQSYIPLLWLQRKNGKLVKIIYLRFLWYEYPPTWQERFSYSVLTCFLYSCKNKKKLKTTWQQKQNKTIFFTVRVWKTNHFCLSLTRIFPVRL